MNTQRLVLYVSSGILLVWGGVLLYYFATGHVNKYLAPAFRNGPLLAGLGLCVLGLFNGLTARLGQTACPHHDHDHGCCGHDHSHGTAQGHEHSHSHDCGHDHSHATAPSHDHSHSHHDCCHGPSHTHDSGCGHAPHEHALSHSHEEPDHLHVHDKQTVPGMLATAVIALVPLLAAASLADHELSTETLANRGLYQNAAPPVAPTKPAASTSDNRYTLADLEKQVRKSPEGNFQIPVPSLFYSAADEELAAVLTGQAVESVGQVVKETPENDPKGTRLRLFRVFISCCLADARPVGFSLEFDKAPPEFAPNSWVKVVGSMTYPQVNGRPVALFHVKSIDKTPTPEDAMF